MANVVISSLRREHNFSLHEESKIEHACNFQFFFHPFFFCRLEEKRNLKETNDNIKRKSMHCAIMKLEDQSSTSSYMYYPSNIQIKKVVLEYFEGLQKFMN